MGELDVFSVRLKQLREKLGISQTEFAELIDVKQQTLSGYERGVMKPPLDVIRNIAEKSHVSIDWLCGLTDKENYSDEIKTYSDAIRQIMKISKEFNARPYVKDDKKNILGLIFNDESLFMFFWEWQKMGDLYMVGSIDQEVYDLWFEKTLKKYDKPIHEKLPFD